MRDIRVQGSEEPRSLWGGGKEQGERSLGAAHPLKYEYCIAVTVP